MDDAPAVEAITSTAPPLPGRRILSQRWSDATFVHWRVDPAEVAPHLPRGTRPDVFDGSAWVGIIAFQMARTQILGGPSIPWLGTFPEINVRHYSVDDAGRRGVVFGSLEASHLLPVLAARTAFGLNYQWARMSLGRRGDLVAYRSRRFGPGLPRTHLVARVLDAPVQDDPLADFLTARWAFHERHLGRTWYSRNSHEAWPLRRAELVHLRDDLLAVAGFPHLAARAPDSVLYSPGVDTVFSAPRRL
ncbi:hypothetical protein CLV49_1025 [Labedella gwakjiensis]|uniref:DUF2071 domain-containing protein n=1 Tax=Labedella gwakjiensis TaxID=390269 RepID=A0A2P8GTW7_9MICO|nr:DUF2071 domain-containing protein [Labedella gwakjiensis]PSL37418.1 hypothetical protein CLV49_1025 [Labedella gwakjiensis]